MKGARATLQKGRKKQVHVLILCNCTSVFIVNVIFFVLFICCTLLASQGVKVCVNYI